MSDPRALYTELLKLAVGNFIYDDDLDLLAGRVGVDPRTGKWTTYNVAARPADPERKQMGEVWPSRAHTMIGMPRLDNLQACVESVLRDGVPGDFIETGVWRGGACIVMRGMLKAWGETDRVVWAADSFAGLPPADRARYPKESELPFHEFHDLAVSLEQVKANFARYGLLDDQVRFLVGWFRDTLPTAPIQRLALLRLDGDMYESTMDALTHLYPKLSPGGYAIIDDYNVIAAANEAVHDYLGAHGLRPTIQLTPRAGAWWRKDPA
jgi:hypothetical protein